MEALPSLGSNEDQFGSVRTWTMSRADETTGGIRSRCKVSPKCLSDVWLDSGRLGSVLNDVVASLRVINQIPAAPKSRSQANGFAEVNMR